jgi:hypothetical protein
MVILMIDIKPVRNDNYNCFQTVVATLATFWRRDYELIFSDQWGFQFKVPFESNNQRIGELLMPGWKGETKEILNRYHGMEITWHINVHYSYAINKLQEELLVTRPIAIYIDSYLCPWSPAFNKYHTDHFFLVVGINVESMDLICVDPYYSNNVEFLSEEIYKDNIHKFCTFSVKDHDSKINWRELLLSYIPQSQSTLQRDNIDPFTMMRSFANEIMHNLDINMELEDNYDMLGVPLLRQLKEIENARYNFSSTLKYISHKFSDTDINAISQQIHEAGETWYKIRLMIMKLAFIPNKLNGQQKISQRINEVADFEERLASDLIVICNKS